MKRTRNITILLLLLLLAVGCIATKTDDGETQWKFKEGVLDKTENVGKGLLGILTALAPILGPIGGIAIGGLATGLTILKKSKPKLRDAQTKGELSNTVASIAVNSLEIIKKDHPEVWGKLSTRLQKECEGSGIDTRIVKNAIRGLRGLPPKP